MVGEWVKPPRTTREPELREDGWIIHYCVGCDTELTDPRWQKCSLEGDDRILCDRCSFRAREAHRRDWWRRD